jgi:hypothetical protein
MPINLKNYAFPERFLITTNITQSLEKRDQDAYQLSMLLLVSSQLGNKEFYQEAFFKMEAVMKNETFVSSPNSYKAWLYGRILLSANSMEDVNTVKSTLERLKNLLPDEKDENTGSDRFTTWTWGYLASLNNKEYNNAKVAMKKAAEQLTCVYTEKNNVPTLESIRQEARSDALWAWVMSLQAAANAKDKEIYEYSLEQIKGITGQESISEALSKGLLRTAASNDYPAWAKAIVLLAAATYDDQELFKELTKGTRESIEEARKAGATVEKMLAQVSNQLAIVRHDCLLLEPKWCPGPDSNRHRI